MKSDAPQLWASPDKITYESIRRQRIRLGIEVETRQKKLLYAARRVFTPQHIVKAVSGALVEQAVNDFSIFHLLGRGRKWLRLGMRIAQHLM